MSKKENEEKIPFREKMKDKKYSAKVQLIGYGVFIIIIIIYVNISSKNYDYNYANKVDGTTSNITSGTIEQSILEKIDNNYDYKISVEIVNDKDETTNYTYQGSKYKEITKILSEDTTYYLKNNEYYKETDGNYDLVSEKDIYKELEIKYIELEEIKNYIKKSSLDHTTNYSNGEIVSTYYLYLKDILPNYYEEDYVGIDVIEKDNILSIEIDYSNLMNYKDNTIKTYKVKSEYSNINSVEEFDIIEN